jgi:acyl-CoA synthetase (AMP-forming)/AMP-acid ligase II
MASLLHEILSDAARRWPRNKAIIEPGVNADSVDYKTLNDRVNGSCRVIWESGLKKGDRIGVLCRNSAPFIIAYFSILRSGGIAVPLNHTLSPEDLASQSEECSIAGLYCGEGMGSKAAAIIKKTSARRLSLDQNKTAGGHRKPARSRKDDPATIVFTSGTTGKPLGVTLSHRNIISNNASIAEYMRLDCDDKVSCVLPFYYIYGLSLIFSHFLVGGTIIIENSFVYANRALDNIDRYGATSFAGVSSHYAILLSNSDIRERAMPSLKRFMQAGDRMPREITEELIKTFPRKRLYLMYGQTEASPRLTYLAPELAGHKPNSVGKPIPGVRIRIIDERGNNRRAGREGEIIARGDNVMLGYWKNKKETARAVKNGWLYTGDIGYRDKDGDLFITARKRGFVKIGAHKVNPLEIEKALQDKKGILETAVVDFPDKILGRRLKLFAVVSPKAAVKESQIMDFCKKRFPKYKIPSEIKVVSRMPRDGYGRIDKDKLRAL